MAVVFGTLTLTFNANGGSGAPSTTSYDYSGEAGSTYSVTLPSTRPSRSGYSFLGWATSSSASSAAYFAGGSYSFVIRAASSTFTVSLYAVWAVAPSTMTVSDGTIGTAQSITVNRHSSSYTHTISYTFGGASGTIVERSSETFIAWTPPISLADQIPNAESGTCVLTCRTYNGSSSVGSSSRTISLAVPDSVGLAIDSVAVTDTIANVYERFDGFVQGRSKLRFVTTLDSENAHGATLQSCTVQFNAQTMSGTNVVSNLLQSNGTMPYTVTIIDSRGKTDTYSGSVSVYAYSPPSIAISTATREDATPTSVDVSFSWAISSVNAQNSKRTRVKYKQATAASYTTAAVITPTEYSGTQTYTITGLSATDAYDIVVEASDAWETVSYSVQLTAQGNRYIECSAQDGTISFNRANPEDGWNHFGKPTWFDDDVRFNLWMASPSTLGGLVFDCGNISERSVASASYETIDVTFAEPFLVPPVVVATVTSAAAANVGNCTASVVSVTTSGCQIKLNNAASAARTIGANWIAIANGRSSNVVGYGIVGTMTVG